MLHFGAVIQFSDTPSLSRLDPTLYIDLARVSTHQCLRKMAPPSGYDSLLTRSFSFLLQESEEQSKTKNHSSESSYETEDSEEEILDRRNNLNFRRSQFHTSNIPESFYFPKNKLNSMSSLDSAVAAASMAALAAINNLGGNVPKSLGNLRFPSHVSAADMQSHWYMTPTSFKMENSSKRQVQETEASDDQPLDLSAKSCSPLNSPTESRTEVPSPVFTAQNLSSSTSTASQSSKVPVYNSNRHIFK